MLDDLMLLSGNDIPLLSAQVNIHQPTISEIAYISEKIFFIGNELLTFDKEISLSKEDKSRLQSKSNFDILMSIMRDQNNPNVREQITAALMVLTLIFPKHIVDIQQNCIYLKSSIEGVEDGFINNDNFSDFQKILVKMFCIIKKEKKEDYNPSGPMAAEIAEKLRKGREKAARLKGQLNQEGKISVISRYLSILSVGQQRDMNSYMGYTLYQLFDEFQRYELKLNYDLFLKAKMAGAKDLKDVDDWMKDIHP